MFQQIKGVTAKSAAFLALLLGLGVLGNFYTLPLHYGADFLFGSIAVLLVLYFYGLGWGMLAAILANAYTYILWGHLYAGTTFILEALFVGLQIRAGRRNLLLMDGCFWLVLGMPLAWFCMGVMLQMDSISATFIMLKQGINGIFNALLASLAISYLPLHQLFDRPDRPTLRLQDTLFNLMVALVLFPLMILTVLEIRGETRAMQTTIIAELHGLTSYTRSQLRSWYKRNLLVLNELARLAGKSSLVPAAQLQHETEILKKSSPDFITLHVENARGISIAFSPAVDGSGKSTTGLDFSQRPWFKEIKETRRPVVSGVFRGNLFVSSPIAAFSVPVLKENNFLGAAAAAIDLKYLQELLPGGLDDENLTITLIDSQGRVVVSSSPKCAPMQSWDRDKTGKFVPVKDAVYHWIPTDQNLPSMTRWKNSFYTQETSFGDELPWKLVVEAPLASQQKRLYTMYVQNLALMAILATGAMLLAMVLSRWIAQPLKRLAQVTTDLPEKLLGSSEIKWPESSAQEIHSLIGNFRSMAGGLERNFLEIQEKSARLAKANQELQTEIKDRELAQEALRESEQQLANIINFLPDATLVIDTAGQVIAWNQAMEEMTGVKARDILGKGNYEYAIPFYGERRPILIDMVVKPHKEIENEYRDLVRADAAIRAEAYAPRLKGGEAYLMAKASALRDSNGKITGAIELVRDISARRQMEETLHRSEQRFRLLAETIQDVFWIATPGVKEMLYVSPAYDTVWGRSREDLYREAQSFADAMHPEDRESALARILAAHSRGISWDLEYRIIKPDEAIRWIQDRGFPVHEEQGEITMFAGICTDVTGHKLLESQLVQSQKMEAVGRLAGGVAHDFNNILTAIMGYTELLSGKLSREDTARNEVAGIQQSAERAATLTSQLLAFSRKQICQPKVLNLNDMVSDLDKMFRRLLGEDIELVTIQSPGLGQVMADPNQMEQVILNLVVNARDAMPRGGKLTIETAQVDLDEDYARRCQGEVRPGPHVMVAVSDTGQGMGAEIVSHIFEPFFTTKEVGQGSGLGLSMVHGIVKQSGGHVSVYSEPGAGTTFKVYLPRLAEPGKTLEAPETSSPPGQGCETILLVEDEEAVRHVIRRGLELNGYEVFDAGTGREAQLLSQQHHGPIHLLVTDVVMPEMSGKDVAASLLAARPEMKVIFMSGHTENAIVHHGVLDPNAAFIQKPFRQKALLEKVRQALDSA